MQVIDDDTLAFPREARTQFMAKLPGAVASERFYRVPWTLENCMAISFKDVPCIGTLPRDYDFSGPWEPKKYQVQAADFLSRCQRAYMFLPAGSGKTNVSLWAADYLLSIGLVKRVLVVCMKSNLYTAWAPALRKHFPHLSYSILSGAKKRKEAVKRTTVHVINHDGIHYLASELQNNKYDLIIYDESTAIGNSNSQRWKAIRRLISHDTWLWEMTATPTPGSPQVAHGQIRLMANVDEDGNRVVPGKTELRAFMSQERWQRMTQEQVNAFSWEPLKNANDTVFRFMQPAFRRDKRDILPELPPVTFEDFDLDLSKEQAKAIKDLQTEQVHDVGNNLTINAVNAGVLISKIFQVCSGIAYAEHIIPGEEEGGERPIQRFATAAKNRQMLELIQQTSAKALVYVPFVAALEPIAAFLRKNGYKVAILQGKVSPKQMGVIVESFQTKSEYDVIVAIPQKMSHGVTATAADLIVWYTPVMRAEVYQQANERTDRIGQRNPTLIAHLSSCPTERKMYDRLQKRTLTQNALLDMYDAFLAT